MWRYGRLGMRARKWVILLYIFVSSYESSIGNCRSLIPFLSLWRKSLTSNSLLFVSRVGLLVLSKFSLKAPYVRIIIRSVIICIRSFFCSNSSFNICIIPFGQSFIGNGRYLLPLSGESSFLKMILQKYSRLEKHFCSCLVFGLQFYTGKTYAMQRAR